MKIPFWSESKPSLRLGAWAGLVVTFGVTGCRNEQEQAVVELERRGKTATAATLVESVRQGDLSLLGFLKTAGVKAPLPPEGQPSVLHLAMAKRNWPLVVQLVDFTDAAVLNHGGPDRQTVFEEAVQTGQFPLVRTLLSRGAKPECAVCGTDDLVRAAAPVPEVMDLILEALPDRDAALPPALLRAATAGEIPRVQRLLERKVAATTRTADGQVSALSLACQGGFVPLADTLLKAGAKPADAPEALLLAVLRQDLLLANLLLASGASPQAPVDPALPDMTPLSAALEARQLPLTQLLLKYGADGAKCLDFALTQGDSSLLDHLLAQGVPVDQPGAGGDPPLIRAAAAGNADLVIRLVEKGAPLEQTGALGQNAFHMAVIHRKVEVIGALLAAGAEPDAPFHKPAPEALIALFDSAYFSKWYKLDENLTPLMLTAARGDTGMVRQLLQGGAQRGVKTKSWHRYPVVFACDTTNVPAAQLLLGRDPDKETEKRHAIVSLSRQRVTLFKNDRPVRSARVSTGKRSTPTPRGKYVITDKQTDWISSIYKVPMPFFMRLSCKEIGLHAGVVPGYPASHGCIRMPRGEVQAFFKILRIGDPVTIEP